MTKTTKSYDEMCTFNSFVDRFRYLQTNSIVGEQTFGSTRYLNQTFYTSDEWRKARRDAIIRDNGCDLGHPDYPIAGSVYVHHINAITENDILNRTSCLFDPNNLVCTSFNTHNAIHYGDESLLPQDPIVRRPNDTCPWKQ